MYETRLSKDSAPADTIIHSGIFLRPKKKRNFVSRNFFSGNRCARAQVFFFFFFFFLLVHLYIWYSVIFLYRINNAMKNKYKKRRKK